MLKTATVAGSRYAVSRLHGAVKNDGMAGIANQKICIQIFCSNGAITGAIAEVVVFNGGYMARLKQTVISCTNKKSEGKEKYLSLNLDIKYIVRIFGQRNIKDMEKVMTTPLDFIQDLDAISKNEKLKTKQGQERCLFCQKPMNVTEKTKYVHLLTNGDLISSGEDFDNSQGLFPVGNECKKKVRKIFLL